MRPLAYEPLARGDYDDDEAAGVPDKEPLLTPSLSQTQRSSALRGMVVPLACASIALLANLLLLVYASSSFRAILGQLEEALDVVDTRALPRPDPLYGLRDGRS